MSAAYNMPHVHGTPQNGDDYAIDDSYSHDGVTSPGMGWDGQSDGGGKFRLKRRRRCGQCGPCQVKENCNKCQYCLRKDVLKQACVYRKCVYLRKPVPRFRQEPATTGGISQKSAPTPPSKPTPTPVPPAPSVSANSSSNSSSNITNTGPSSNSSNVTPVPNTAASTEMDAAASHNAEFSSCRLNQSPFVTLSTMQSISNGVLDPLRHRMMEHPHRSLFDPMNLHSSLDSSRSTLDSSKPLLADTARFPSGPAAPGCKLDQGAPVISYASDINPASVAMASPLNSVNSALGAHQSYQPNKGSSLPPRDPYFSSMDTWSSVPYALPHAPTWATPALPNHHAAAYGFQQHPTAFPPSFTPSCRLGLSDSAASQYASPAGPQPSFHHSMTGMTGFSQDIAHAASSHAAMRGPMNPPFYHTPPHIPPSGITSFHGLGQFPASQASFGPAAYTMHPHTHMYPSGFYSFRAATEPQIYHVEIYPSHNPFKNTLMQLPYTFLREKGVKSEDIYPQEYFSKDVGYDISERLHLNLASSDTFSTSKDIISNIFKKLEVLSTDNLNTNNSEHGKVQNSCIPSNFYAVKDRPKYLDYFEKVMISPAPISKKEAVKPPCGGKTTTRLLRDTSGSSKCLSDCDGSLTDHDMPGGNFDGSNTISFPSCTRIDMNLQNFLTGVCHCVECDECVHGKGQTAMTVCDLGSDVIIHDDGDGGFCSQTEKETHTSGDPFLKSTPLTTQSFMEASSVTLVSQTYLSAAFLSPAILPCSSCHPSVDEDRHLPSEQNHIISEGSIYESHCTLSKLYNNTRFINGQTNLWRMLKRSLPWLEKRREKYNNRGLVLGFFWSLHNFYQALILSIAPNRFFDLQLSSSLVPPIIHQIPSQLPGYVTQSKEDQHLTEVSLSRLSTNLLFLSSRESAPSLSMKLVIFFHPRNNSIVMISQFSIRCHHEPVQQQMPSLDSSTADVIMPV